MQQWKSVDEILDFAIGQEEQAAQFYTDLAGRMDRPWMSQIFKDFAKEEMWHKSKLVEVKSGKRSDGRRTEGPGSENRRLSC